MTRQENITRCYSELQKLNDNSVLNTSEMDFYNNFTNKYSPFSYEMFSEISGTDFLIAVVNSKFEDIPFENPFINILFISVFDFISVSFHSSSAFDWEV